MIVNQCLEDAAPLYHYAGIVSRLKLYQFFFAPWCCCCNLLSMYLNINRIHFLQLREDYESALNPLEQMDNAHEVE